MSIVKRIGSVLAGALFLLSASAFGQDCDRPERPTIPSNANTDLELMLDAQDDVQAFMGASNDYITCMDRLIEQVDADEEQMRMADLVAQRNGSIDDQEAVAAAFNEQLELYQASQ